MPGFFGNIGTAAKAIGHDMMNHQRLGAGGQAMDMFGHNLPTGSMGTGLKLSDVAGIFGGHLPGQFNVQPGPTIVAPQPGPLQSAPSPQIAPAQPAPAAGGVDIGSIMKLLSMFGGA